MERYLESLRFSSEFATAGLEEAMRYSLLAPGKRIRPVLALATADAIGRDPQTVLPLAAALELIHTYSLIHDDLPAMDDDDLRRGRLTCHKAFGEDVAILAGDGLYAEAFRLLLTEQRGEPEAVLAASRELAAATGVQGMVGGQYLDVAATAPEGPAGLRRLHELKTGRLIAASIECVLLLAGDGKPDTIDDYRAFASELGVLFQIVDDILDVTGSEAALGKHQGSDERLGKRTYVSEFGLDGARRLAGESHERARGAARRGTDRGHRTRADHGLHRNPELLMTDLLNRIEKPQDLHGLTDEQLQQVAQEVREHIINTVGEIGGHFGANLGTCEIAVALHSLLDSPRDKILWDVGHQAYPHKILTGRRDQLDTIRKYEGLAPFCSIHESEHDIMGAGHASTAIGYAVGIKEAMRRGHGPDGHVVAVAGDGAMTGGVAFEAVHQAGGEGTPIVVVLNDNGMSIAPNVGRDVAVLQPRPPEPEAVARPRGRRGRADQAAGRDRPRVRAARPPRQGVDQGLLGAGAVVGGARLRLHGRDRRPRRPRAAPRPARGAGRRAPGGGALRHRQGQGLCPRRGRRAGGDGEVARRQAQVDRQRRPRARQGDQAGPRGQAGAARLHPGVRRRRWWPSPAATSG